MFSIGRLALLCGALMVVGACGDDTGTVPLCEEGSRKDCKTADGADGEQVCTGGYWGTCAPAKCTEGATLTCTQTDGTPGQKVCQGGSWTACGKIPGQCEDGTYKQCTTSDNKPGYQKCVNGAWEACQDQNPPDCKDGSKQACSTACGTGTEICVNGTWQNCDAPKPAQEKCDGFDNNCDGTIDEVCICVHGTCEECYTGPAATKNVGQCKAGQRCCDKGIWGECLNSVLPAAAEDCTDAIDNDCDGTVNNGCTCTIGAKQTCGTNVGECTTGQQVCEVSGSTAAWGTCLGGIAPAAEKLTGCDGLDNDCNGVIDNGLDPDGDEVNDKCSQARSYEVADDGKTVTITGTIYPSGDVDYFRITAKEAVTLIPLCVPFDPQCLFLEAQIVQPTQTGVQYKLTLLDGTCTVPTATFNSTTKVNVQWEGQCVLEDTKDMWSKIEPTSSSNPTWSCKPYKVKLTMTKKNEACTTSP